MAEFFTRFSTELPANRTENGGDGQILSHVLSFQFAAGNGRCAQKLADGVKVKPERLFFSKLGRFPSWCIHDPLSSRASGLQPNVTYFHRVRRQAGDEGGVEREWGLVSGRGFSPPSRRRRTGRL